jgi:subtilisin family serine protease
MKILSSLLAATLLLLAIGPDTPVAAVGDDPLAPILHADSPDALAGRYIVVFKPGAGASAVDLAIAQATQAAMAGPDRANRGIDPDRRLPTALQVEGRFDKTITGFAAALPASALEAVRRNPAVAYIEVDQEVRVEATQAPVTWGLDRIDQRALPLSRSYTYNFVGSGVNVYVIDSGIRITHAEFGGRAAVAFDNVGDGRQGLDCHGHGTHVAGTIGGVTYGVAKAVKLYAVRVLNCYGSGSTSGVIAGVEWVTKNAKKPAVANVSLGGITSTTLDTAVQNSIKAGIVYVIAAGNNNQSACNYSPARVSTAITVGATTVTDARASFSNYGSCLDLFAPGSSITSAWYMNDTATNTISGTSMAAPHVSGVAALYLQRYPKTTPQQARDAIVKNALRNVVTNPGTGSPNYLLYSLFFK